MKAHVFSAIHFGFVEGDVCGFYHGIHHHLSPPIWEKTFDFFLNILGQIQVYTGYNLDIGRDAHDLGRYEHPYEHDQKLVSAFLRAGERVAFDDELPVRMEDVPSALGSDTAGKLT